MRSKSISFLRSKRKRNQFFAILASLTLISSFQNCQGGSFEVASNSADLAGLSDLPSTGGGSGSQPTPGGRPPELPPPVAMGNQVTEVKLQNISSSEQKNVPFTFGHTFYKGAISSTLETLAGKLADGTALTLQVEAKAKHADGSIRHAIISGVLPTLPASQTVAMALVKAAKPASNSMNPDPMTLINAGFGAVVTLNVGGTQYQASANDGLQNNPKLWLKGLLVNEWLVAVPFKTSAGVEHPHLMARFAIRAYTGLSRAKVDVVLENNWSYEPAPQNFTYNVNVSIGGQNVYTKTSLTHFHHSRWKKTFWWGTAPSVHIQHNVNDLIMSRALPNYDQSVVISESTISNLHNAWVAPKNEPMNFGVAQPYMPATGGRPDIGLNPGWAVTYLLTQDVRAKNVTLGQADLAGSWSMHYRDKQKDTVHSILDYPYSSIIGTSGDKMNPVTKKSEAFPACGGDCTSAGTSDVSHTPNLAYIPYLVTGDFYYLEELQFWAAYVVFTQNGHYREMDKGLVKSDQLRGQGWAIRLLGEASYISPDDHPMKSQFTQIVNNNLDWYNENYTNNPNANKLGIIVNGYSVVYDNGSGTAPWQDDFFTQAIGHLTELDFDKAKPLLTWKSKFQISRMTDPNYCWIMGAIYALKVRDSLTAPFYTTMGQAYQASVSAEVKNTACASAEMSAALTKEYGYSIPLGSMTGYPTANAGMPANYQPALAYAATSGAADGPKAWDIFSKRNAKPTYSDGAQFAIVPRK